MHIEAKIIQTPQGSGIFSINSDNNANQTITGTAPIYVTDGGGGAHTIGVTFASGTLAGTVSTVGQTLAGQKNFQADVISFGQMVSNAVFSSTLSSSTTFTIINFENGNNQSWSFNAPINTTFSLFFTNALAGGLYNIAIYAGSTSKSLLFTNTLWVGGQVPLVSQNNNSVDLASFYCLGATFLGRYFNGFA